MVAAHRITKRARPLDAATVAAIPAQLGVYEIVASDGATLYIGAAGGREPFGLRGALESQIGRWPGASFRHESTHGYRSRWQELLMAHVAEHGSLPQANEPDARLIGRLR